MDSGALDLLGVEVFDLVVLDLNLPRIDGMTVLRELRKTDCETKVLILSARGEVSDKVAGLDAGANDYLTKPFHLDELAARIRSLTLRRFAQSDIVLTCGKLSFDTKARIASVDSEALSLTRKETGILEYLMLNQGRPVSQEELIEHVWDSSVNSFSNATRVHISSLRKATRRFGIRPDSQSDWRGLRYGGWRMKRLSLQWRITIMTALLTCAACVLTNCLVGYTGMRYMDAIGSDISAINAAGVDSPQAFDPTKATLDDEVTIVVNDAQESFGATAWCITAGITLLGGVLAYFVSGRALKPLRAFAAQVERVQPDNLSEIRLSEDARRAATMQRLIQRYDRPT